MNRSRSSTIWHSFHGITTFSPNGRKCHLCLRNEVLPISREGHSLNQKGLERYVSPGHVSERSRSQVHSRFTRGSWQKRPHAESLTSWWSRSTSSCDAEFSQSLRFPLESRKRTTRSPSFNLKSLLGETNTYLLSRLYRLWTCNTNFICFPRNQF